MTDSAPFLPPKGQRLRWLAILVLALAPFAFGIIAIGLGQDANWDLRNYHWYNAYAFLNGRYGIDLLPSQTPWFYNPTLDVPFYLLATHVEAIWAGFALGCVQGLNFILLFMLASASLRIPNPRHKFLGCLALAALGMYGGGGIALLGTTFYDNVTSLGIFLSALLVVGYWPRLAGSRAFPGQVEAVLQPASSPPLGGDPSFWAPGQRQRKWIPARAGMTRFYWIEKCSNLLQAVLLAAAFGIPAGLMIGLKLPSVIFGVGLCGAFLFAAAPLTRRMLLAFGFGCGILIGVLVSFGHWGWYLQSHFGSPVFPYFNQIFHAPLAPAASARDTQYVTRSLHDALLFPFIFADSPFRVGEIAWRDWRLPILYVLIPAAIILRLIFARPRQPEDAVATPQATRYLLGVAVLSYLAWLLMFCIYRYIVPLEMLAPLLIVLAAGLLPLKPQSRALLTVFILLVVAGSVQGGNWHRRNEWLENFVEVEKPPLNDTGDVMILMAGFEPYAHLLPSFPADITFVRIESNFASPNEHKGINDIIKAKVMGHHGPLLLLIPSWQHGIASDALRSFGLTAQWRACQTVTDRLYDNQLFDLCPVK